MSVTFLTGDVREQLATLPEKSVHCCVTSPPYWTLRDYGIPGQIGNEPSPEQYAEALTESLVSVHRVLRDDGTLWLNIGDTYRDKQLVGVPWLVAFALRRSGWRLCQEVIWHKPDPMRGAVVGRCVQAHEQVFLFSKSPSYFFDIDAIRTEHGSLPVSVWKIAKYSYRGGHFAAFPPDLIRPAICAGTSSHGVCATCGTPHTRVVSKTRTPTRPGRESKVNDLAESLSESCDTPLTKMTGNRDPRRHVTVTKTIGWAAGCRCNAAVTPATVLDPFGGSGTTALVASEEGRVAIHVDINPEYIDLAKSRLAGLPQGNAARIKAYANAEQLTAKQLAARRKHAIKYTRKLLGKLTKRQLQDAHCIRSIPNLDSAARSVATEYRDLFPADVSDDLVAESLLTWLRNGVE